jgi:hypothetical protein
VAELLRRGSASAAVSLLRRARAYHVQEQAFGGLPASVAQMLDRLTDSSSMAGAEPGTKLYPQSHTRGPPSLIADDLMMSFAADRRPSNISWISSYAAKCTYSGLPNTYIV